MLRDGRSRRSIYSELRHTATEKSNTTETEKSAAAGLANHGDEVARATTAGSEVVGLEDVGGADTYTIAGSAIEAVELSTSVAGLAIDVDAVGYAESPTSAVSAGFVVDAHELGHCR